MLNDLFGSLQEIREMNNAICERLDLIAALIDDLIVAVKETKVDYVKVDYGNRR